MRLLSVVALCLSGIVVATGYGEDKPQEKAKNLTGAFKRKAGDLDLKIVFKKDNVMEFHAAHGDVSMIMTSKYKVEKGVYSFEVTDFTKKGDFPVTKEKGYKFSMKIAVGDKKITVSEFTGQDIEEGAKQAVEGDYTTASD